MPKPIARSRLGLGVRVFRLDPEISQGRRGNDGDVDPDGHFVSYMMEPISREVVCQVQFARDLEPGDAASMLRKLADRIEQHGDRLLKLDPEQLGHFDATGAPVGDDMNPDQAAQNEENSKCPDVDSPGS